MNSANYKLNNGGGGIRFLKDIDNYIYFHHIDLIVALPTFANTINDTQNVSFASTNILGRSAPIYSYSYSGPRSIMFDFKLHRDEMSQINHSISGYVGHEYDIVDTFIKQCRAAALPSYAASAKMVNPPIVSVRCSDDIFITGVVSGAVSVMYDLPIISYNGEDKYASVGVSFTVNEIEPYDAEEVVQVGGYRGVTGNLVRNVYVNNSTQSGYTGGGGGGGSRNFAYTQLQ